MLYSFLWERVCSRKNIIQVRITFLDEQGKPHVEQKYYEEWIGVCTSNIDRVVHTMKQFFPGHNVLYQQIGDAKKILPYFEDRLAKGKLDYRSKPFYKVYTTASHKNVGRLFNRYKIGYYDPEDWLVRIYIDLCTRYDTHSFYYKWYELHNDSPGLTESLRMIPDRKDPPDWTVAAFDLETVPLVGNHIPIGYDPNDRIVMISLYKWNRREGMKTWILYLLPDGIDEPLLGYEYGFTSEADMLVAFHELLADAQILTGYNINAFDLPCLFARLVWLRLVKVLRHYTSANVGMDVVVTYDKKITIDLYSYFKTFSGYDLPSYKLDDVARIKLGERKLPVKATGVWSWYRYPNLPRELLEEDDLERCFRAMNLESDPLEFGTFRMYLDYCLRDSELVARLFQKEDVVSFLVERANFSALNAVEALHLGNSRYLLELFKTYGLRLGYFINPKFLTSDDSKKQMLLGNQKTYQGALNYCMPEKVYENVSVMDFSSMYPSALLNGNLCYGTCTIMTRDEWLANPVAQQLTTIPYRQHSDADFRIQVNEVPGKFSYPPFDPAKDEFVIVANPNTEAFLPQFVLHFIQMRKYHQKEYKKTGDMYHYNVQLGIKILVNSLYGVMANKDSPLAYLVIAISIVTLSRYQLLGSYHYLKCMGYNICYADTDSLMVQDWPVDDCESVNAFLGMQHVELKYEQRMKRLIVLSKKRYVYQRADGMIVIKGFQKKTNDLIQFMTRSILNHVWLTVFESADSSPSQGWIVWVDTLLEANYRCRDPKKFSIYRKMKKLEDYVSETCVSVKFLKKYPDLTDEHVEFTYSRADIAEREASNWVMIAEDCKWVNYEKLFISQKKIFCTLLNMAYWKMDDPTGMSDMVLNAIHWKRFVHAELLHWHATRGRTLTLLVEPGIKYTFTINDHVRREVVRGRKRKEAETNEDDPG